MSFQLFLSPELSLPFVGGISAAVKTTNERKTQLQAQKELEKHHNELEKQIGGSGVIVDFVEKLESA